MIRGVQGDVVECGVRGGSSFGMLAQCIHDEALGRLLVGYDVWDGVALFSQKPDENFVRAIDLDKVQRFFPLELEQRGITGVSWSLVRGWFRDTLPGELPERIAFAHLDCDLEASMDECLPPVWERLSPGGVIVVDDWGEEKWPGVARAILRFFHDREDGVMDPDKRRLVKR